MAVQFIPVDRDTPFLLPPSVDEWLPQGHLARFVVEVVGRLDTSRLEAAYSGRGSAAYHPQMLFALLVYGYATGTFSSRRLEAATYDSIAVRYLTANTHPDHDTIATFRRRFLPEVQQLFAQLLVVAREMGLLSLGRVCLDGTKVKANASKHNALSHGRATELEAKLKAEVADLLRQAEKADQQDERQPPDDLPAELQRRETRLAAIAEAKRRIEARAAERDVKANEAHAAQLAERERKERERGRKHGGQRPKPPATGPRPTDQVNLTDDESRIMPVSGGGFEQAYNAQACVDVESLLIVEQHVSQAPNDQHELALALESLGTLAGTIGKVDTVVADNGYYSKANAALSEAGGVTPLLAMGRERHGAPKPMGEAAATENQTAEGRMRQRLESPEGRALYARRKCTVEPVFGIIKHVMGFRQFSLRGVDKVRGEWTLVSMAWNMKRMARLHAIAS